MIVNEWVVLRDRGDGWHDVGHGELEVTRSGEIVKRRGLFFVEATVCGPKQALEVARLLAEARGDRVRRQTENDLRDPMFAALDEKAA